MAVLIIASELDVAAQNIARELVRSRDFRPVHGTSEKMFERSGVFLKHVDTDGIHAEDLGLDVKVDLVIFASRHRSESGEPTLTAHWSGNATSRADFGGNAKSLSLADPPRLRAALLALDSAREANKLAYAVSLEATHHGPTELGVPTLFVEIGSTEKEWNDPQAAAAVGEAIWAAATEPVPGKNAIGFGGGHYCSKQSVAIRKDGYAFGHILSKYFFDEYDEEIVHMAFDRTIGECCTALIDWKGVRGTDRTKLLRTLEQMRIEVVRV